jgi:hypothetical protein
MKKHREPMPPMIESLNSWSKTATDLALAILWQSALLASVVAGVCWVLRRASPGVRYWLWQIVAIKLLVMPLWTLAIPLPGFFGDGTVTNLTIPPDTQGINQETGAFLPGSGLVPGQSGKDAPPLLQLNLVKREGGEVRRLGKPSAAFGRFSPDGKKVLFMKMSEKRGEGQLFVMDLVDGKTTQVSKELNAELMGHCWAPDSKRIAYVWRQTNPMPNGQTESFLMIVDADGKNPVTLLSEKSDNQGMITLSSPDWR